MKNAGLPQTVACVGLDCHRNFSSATARDGSMKVLWRKRLNHRDRRELHRELSSWPAGTPVILEGTFGWGWMSDELKAAKLQPHLSSSRKVAGWREARGMPKSNKRDADLLSELWGQQPRWWEVWCAPPEVRDMRELLRQRCSLVRLQTRLKNQIHASLHRHGLICEVSDLFGVKGRAWLASALEDTKSPLREIGRQTLANNLQLLDQVRKRVAEATHRFRKMVRRDPVAKRLMTLPGVSTILAYTILAEIGRIERFKDGRHLASYSMLAPISDDSGDDHPGQAPVGRHVGVIGRTTLKWAWITAARGAVRKSARMRGYFDRYTKGGTINRNRGYIAVGHQMCLIGYAMWKKQQDYQETPPLRPGSEKHQKQSVQQENQNSKTNAVDTTKASQKKFDSRPGTGQPVGAMAMPKVLDRHETDR